MAVQFNVVRVLKERLPGMLKMERLPADGLVIFVMFVCKIDSEGNARKVVGCSCIVVEVSVTFLLLATNPLCACSVTFHGEWQVYIQKERGTLPKFKTMTWDMASQKTN